MELSKKFASLSQKHKALAADVKLQREKRQVSLKKIKATEKDVMKTMTALSTRLVDLKAKLRGAQLKAQMNSFVVAGKVNPVELSKMDFKALGALPQTAIDVILSSYESRQVSTDVYQYGQAGSAMSKAPTTKAEMAEAIKLQKSGKSVSLAERVVEEKPVDEAKAKLEGEEDKEPKKIGHDEMKDILAEMDDHHGKVGECMEKLKSLGEEADQMYGADKKEEEHLSDDEGEDLAASEDDEDGKPKDKKEEK